MTITGCVSVSLAKQVPARAGAGFSTQGSTVLEGFLGIMYNFDKHQDYKEWLSTKLAILQEYLKPLLCLKVDLHLFGTSENGW